MYMIPVYDLNTSQKVSRYEKYFFRVKLLYNYANLHI